LEMKQFMQHDSPAIESLMTSLRSQSVLDIPKTSNCGRCGERYWSGVGSVWVRGDARPPEKGLATIRPSAQNCLHAGWRFCQCHPCPPRLGKANGPSACPPRHVGRVQRYRTADQHADRRPGWSARAEAGEREGAGALQLPTLSQRSAGALRSRTLDLA